jgi:hypothetical protein
VDIVESQPMRNARHLIAVTLMATALCADRAIPAAPTQTPSANLATRLIERLTVSLRGVVPNARLYQPRRFGLRPADERPAAALTLDSDLKSVPLSPFQFRLPPPLA